VRRPAKVTLLAAGLALLLASGVSAQFGQNKIAYDHFDWKIAKTTHFEVHHYTTEPELLAKVSSMAESAYARIRSGSTSRFRNGSRSSSTRPTPTSSRRTSTRASSRKGSGAFAEPARNRMVLPADLPDDELQKLIAPRAHPHLRVRDPLSGGAAEGADEPSAALADGRARQLHRRRRERPGPDDPARRGALRLVPPIASSQIGGYFAYRFGHAAFSFIEETWGVDGVRDFVFEFRSALGNNVEKALKRAFDVTPEEFDVGSGGGSRRGTSLTG